jgi:hypothetical protein
MLHFWVHTEGLLSLSLGLGTNHGSPSSRNQRVAKNSGHGSPCLALESRFLDIIVDLVECLGQPLVS